MCRNFASVCAQMMKLASLLQYVCIGLIRDLEGSAASHLLASALGLEDGQSRHPLRARTLRLKFWIVRLCGDQPYLSGRVSSFAHDRPVAFRDDGFRGCL